MSARDQLNSYLQQLEKRLRLGALLRGAAILTSVALVATLLLVLITNAFAFSHGSITSARVVLFFVIAFAASFGIALPLLALNRRRAARRAETVFPQFQERLVTYAERDARTQEPFLDLLAADTLRLASEAEPERLASRRNLLALLTAGAASLGVLIWLILAGPGYLGEGAALLWAATPRNGTAPFYDIRVTPGNATVRRNSDQLITAQLVGLQTDTVRLYARYQGATKWEQVKMQPQPGASGFQFVFAGLPENVEYYVEAGPLRSPHYHLHVLDLPAVKDVRVTYRFPAWTGLKNAVQDHDGDLRAVKGTEADIQIETDRPMQKGMLVLEDNQQLQLSAGGPGNVYKGTIHIDKDGTYHVAALEQGQPVRVSGDYFIEARKANPPEVVISRPGGDYRASPIEEVTVSVKADDEFGLQGMALHYSVNGGADKTVDLLKQKGARQADGSTVLSLENFKLVPGDLVSLYATAKDAHAQSHTDMFFIQTEPFEREFSQSQQMGGGGGMGMGGQNDISRREKEIIAQTWKQKGDTTATPGQAADTAKFLSDVQSKLQAQAMSLAGRMQSRKLSQENEEFKGFVKDMSSAAGAMGPAADRLAKQKWQDALPHEQKALEYLLRAEATFRRIEVAFGNGGGGGGGGGAGRDLASLFDLELDTEKNQYETAQTAASSASQPQQQIDEALQKLDQLARRQQDLAHQQPNNLQSTEQRWQQEMLRRQAEQLQRRMEQLARSNGQNGSQGSASSGQSGSGGAQGSMDPRVQQSLDRLRQATNDMRQAATPQQEQAAARRAADRLREAANLLGSIRQQQASQQLDSIEQEAHRLAGEQRDQSDRARQLFGQQLQQFGSQSALQQMRKLADDRQQLAQDLGQLEKKMQDTARNLDSGGQRAASAKLRDALGDLQESDLRSRIQRGAEWMRRGINPNANGMDPEITAGMQRLEKDLQDAQQALSETPKPSPDSQQGLEAALNRVQQLRNQVQSLSRNGRGGQQGQGGRNGQNAQNGASGPVGGPGARMGGGNYGNGYRAGNPGGPRGYYGFDTGNNTPAGGPPVQPDRSPIPPQRAYQNSLRDLNQLRQTVQADPEASRELQDLIRQMQKLNPSRFPGNPALVEQLHSDVLAGIDKLELQLRRQLDDKQTGQIRSGDSQTVPPGYEESVADYYRRLSKNK